MSKFLSVLSFTLLGGLAHMQEMLSVYFFALGPGLICGVWFAAVLLAAKNWQRECIIELMLLSFGILGLALLACAIQVGVTFGVGAMMGWVSLVLMIAIGSGMFLFPSLLSKFLE